MIAVAELLRRLGHSRARLLATIGDLGDPAFSRPPLSGAWSVSHVVEHLARVDDAVTRTGRQRFGGPPGPPVRWTDRLRQLPYRLNLADRVRVRTGAALDPKEAAPRGEALARLEASRAALRALLTEHDGWDLSRWTMPHPIFGHMPADDMVALIAWHEVRHTRQVDRILLAMPKATRES